MYAEQLEHLTSVGAFNFQTLERLLFLLADDVLLAGTAIFIASFIQKTELFTLHQAIAKVLPFLDQHPFYNHIYLSLSSYRT